MQEVITVGGIKKKRSKNGYFCGCPYKCDIGTGYPLRKWKTEKGIRKHASECSHSPSKVAERKAEEEARNLKREKEAVAKIAALPFSVGDTIYYWYYNVTKPTHKIDYRGRLKRVRYEEEREYRSATAKVESLTATLYGVLINNDKRIKVTAIVESEEKAAELARAEDKAYKERCEFAARCR